MVHFALAVLSTLSAVRGERVVDAGPLKLRPVISESAQIFHIVDQLSRWSPYCHAQYRDHFASPAGGGLSAKDEQQLLAHAELRKQFGYGKLDETFYVAGGWQQALDSAVRTNRLDGKTAAIERAVLRHFANRLLLFIRARAKSADAAAARFATNRATLETFAAQASRFWGGGTVDLPIYLIATPGRSGGGGFNGGKLVVETGTDSDPVNTAIHESWHAFAEAKRPEFTAAAKAAGTDEITFSEGLAYAASPGIYDMDSRALDKIVARDFAATKSFVTDVYARYSRFGLALRPLLRDALQGAGESVELFLPKAVTVYRSVLELSSAMDNLPKQYFCFGDGDAVALLLKQIGANGGADVWGRRLGAKDFAQVSAHMRRGDVVVLVAERNALLQAPQEFQQAWGADWSQLQQALATREAGQLRAETPEGPRVAIWAKDAAALAAALPTDGIQKLLRLEP